MKVANSRKKCPVTYSKVPLFFSLVDYRNNYFTSNDSDKIIEFYNGFENREQLIQWMRERPKGVANIHEVKGDNEIIVVIPTADFKGEYARECMENVFKGLHIVFVESGGREDFYFNYAHNCNMGIKKAMEYNPKWVVVSNDDVYKIDDVSVLSANLQKLDNNLAHLIFTEPPGEFHSLVENIGITRTIRNLVLIIRKNNRAKLSVEKKMKIKIITWREWYKYLHNIFYKRLVSFPITLAFSILSGEFVRSCNGYIFDEVYVNGFEDVDLSFNVGKLKQKSKWIKFKLGDYVASTLGTGEFRVLRDICNRAYFESKYSNELSLLSKKRGV